MTTVRDILNHKETTAVITVHPEMRVFEAIKIMAECGIGSVLVCSNNHLVGVMTERDYARKIILAGRSSRATAVSEIMTTPVHTVSPDAPISHCRQVMTDRYIRYLPVVEGNQILGIVSQGDIVAFMIEEKDFVIGQLTTYITGSPLKASVG